MSPVLKRTRTAALGLGGGVLAAALWWRKHPSACPYGQRFWLEPPHPLITRRRLDDVLAPQRGERVLEVGPGTGYYTLAVAERLAPDGRLDIIDLQQEMLNHTMRSARERGLDNITATQGDARRLPYADASFDAAYLTAVLGEIPDQDAALRELARVLKPSGRLVVGELFGDPHWVTPKRLREARPRRGPGVNAALRHLARLLRAIPPRPRILMLRLATVSAFKPSATIRR